MVTPQSPSRMFNGLDEDIYNEVKFQHEINDKMRVPKRIKATGEFSDEDMLLNQNGRMNSWNYHDKIDMNVPDRIVVLGHNQHLETRSAPREIQLENSLLPKNESNLIRVQTPPRIITLNEHHFPSASEESSPHKITGASDYGVDDFDDDDDMRPPPYVRANGIAHATVGFYTSNDANSVDSESQLTTAAASKHSQQQYNNDTSIVGHRDGTPIGELTPHEEILYLRRQLAKINRRVLNLEISNEQKLQREKIIYCLGLAYFVLKAIFWINRN